MAYCDADKESMHVIGREQVPLIIYFVTHRHIARQELSKHIPTGASTFNNMTSIARQRFSTHASLTVEAVFSAWSMQSGYKEVFSNVK
jgi:hypothetical protein